tara:strand:- start:2420 stop:3673 length:1254 start_codon:yes stop_codon:yes gene_type:complete
MFEALKKKFQSFIGKKPEPSLPKGKTKKTSKASKPKTPKKTEKPTKVKKTKEKTIPDQLEKPVEEKLKEQADKIPEEQEVHLEPDAVKQFEGLKAEQSVEEQIKDLPKESIESPDTKEESQGFFSKLKKSLTTSVLTQEQFDEIFPDLEISLLQNNVSLSTVDKIRSSLSQDLVGLSIKRSEIKNIDKLILNSLKSAISSVLIEPPSLKEQVSTIKSSLSPYVILFFGINGSGKTTSIAKLAHLLKSKGISVCLTAADTFRAASIEQLEEHANKLKIPIIKSPYGSDPASVAHDAISYAKKNKIQAILIDTAGRMYTASNLMKEMEKIIKISNPDLKIFVGESITGNDATEQAKTFNEQFGIDGIILSKADIDEKAGTILSVSHTTNKPIYFLGTGQSYSDLVPFTKETVLKNLGLE